MSDPASNPAPALSGTYAGDLPDPRTPAAIEPPPSTIPGILLRLGPGLIIAGSIVGSGELIGTTRTGAEAGVWLLWLIVIGCIIKVFTQIEFGRFTLTTGRTTMDGLNEVPGPRARVNWILWYWLVMFIFSLAQLGGIVGGVGHSLAMTFPITGDFIRLLDDQKKYDDRFADLKKAVEAEVGPDVKSDDLGVRKAAKAKVDARMKADTASWGPRPSETRTRTWDDLIWAVVVTAVTVVMLVAGRYGLIEWVSTILVAGFTLATVVNLILLQNRPEYALTFQHFADGFAFRLAAPGESGWAGLSTALKTFGIIGVGASELLAYPYWCLEKGYARYTGPRDSSPEWGERARGWMRVMRWDAWCSAVIYTFATVAFFLLGATVLHHAGRIPGGCQLIRTLGLMYQHVFGAWANFIFLIGAFAVLYSTFFVANAGHARVASDAARVFGLLDGRPETMRRWVTILSGVFPVVCLVFYILIPDPVGLVLASGLMQALMLPMLAGAAIYFRWQRSDPRIKPSPLWDVLLVVSAIGMLVSGLSAAALELAPFFAG